MIENIPKELMDLSILNYPIHNKSIGIEGYFYNYYINEEINTELTYLPIQWTNYLVKNKYGKDIEMLKSFINSLDFKNNKFFTITQYDGGPLVNLNNTIVFSCSGMFNTPKNNNLSYINIPLLTEKQTPNFMSRKKIKVGYLGRNTHKIREELLKIYQHLDGYELINYFGTSASKKDNKLFRKLTSKSIFTLCPRGYGPTSFRLYESINLGSIPIYISDDFILPFQDKIDWDKLALLIKLEDIDSIHKKVEKILNNNKHIEMLNYGKECNIKYFNMEYTSNYISEQIQNFGTSSKS
tara:strand:- start:49212 stop:50099 length:888 start_codon:yes stop_codon:yes gene_type:complete